VLATPPAQHAEQAVQASQRAIHLVVDKPFAPSLRSPPLETRLKTPYGAEGFLVHQAL
jgi:hypothetical protein